jgi:acetyl esterase/lipase
MSINYLLASRETAAFPQNNQDCEPAVRWLRKNADRLQLDTARIGAIGGSAGGHLTALLAVSGPETDASALWDSGSPIKQLSKDAPPLLITHGTADTTTALDQSTRLREAAPAIGVPSDLIVIEGALHSFRVRHKERDLRPDVIAFFDTHLKPHE